MKTIKILILLLLAISVCKGQTRGQAKIEYRTKRIIKNKFAVSFIISVLEDQRIISPFSKDSIWVKTAIIFHDSLNIKLSGPLTELPMSKMEFDPITGKYVRFNRKHVTFDQTLEILCINNFKTIGQIEYMIITDKYAMPPNKVNFVLTYDKSNEIITID